VAAVKLSIMKRILRSPFVLAGMLAVLLALAAAGVFAENIVAPNQYAWGERVGWINFKPGTGPGVTVTNTNVAGYAWGERIGWVSLSCHNDEPGTTCASRGIWGITNDGAGNLRGQAWSERDGWISFSCHNDEPGTTCASRGNWGVTVNSTTGVFSGQAWGERTGWITFNCATTASCGSASYQVQTGWRAGTPVAVGGNAEQPDRGKLPAEASAPHGHVRFVTAAEVTGIVAAAIGGAWALARRRRHVE
jgi:hypothetical protein